MQVDVSSGVGDLELVSVPHGAADSRLVSWCFKPSQPQRITSGLTDSRLKKPCSRVYVLMLICWFSHVERQSYGADYEAGTIGYRLFIEQTKEAPPPPPTPPQSERG